jgi:F420H(2)-dependent quinone reductase
MNARKNMNDLWIKGFMALNAFLLRLSRGRFGSRLGKQTVLLLHTIGRKSGQDRAIPIAYFELGKQYLIVASNWGRESQAAWYMNLKHNPHARLEVKGRILSVTAHEAEGEEYDRLWKYVTDRHPPYLQYQEGISRRIPIMVFE